MSNTVVETSSVLGIIGWSLLASFAIETSGIGDGAAFTMEIPTSFYLPFVYFTICIISCFLSRWLLLLTGIIGTICLGSMIYLLIAYGWLPIVSIFLVIILLGHGWIWWAMLAERIRKNE